MATETDVEVQMFFMAANRASYNLFLQYPDASIVLNRSPTPTLTKFPPRAETYNVLKYMESSEASSGPQNMPQNLLRWYNITVTVVTWSPIDRFMSTSTDARSLGSTLPVLWHATWITQSDHLHGGHHKMAKEAFKTWFLEEAVLKVILNSS